MELAAIGNREQKQKLSGVPLANFQDRVDFEPPRRRERREEWCLLRLLNLMLDSQRRVVKSSTSFG